jgi:hypothetical protein
MRLSALILTIVLVIAFLPCVFAWDVFWLRGEDTQILVNGNFHNSISEGKPTEFVNETKIELNQKNKTVEFYHEPLQTDIKLSGKAYLWISKIKGSGKLRFNIIDFNPNSNNETKIASSQWTEIINEKPFEATAEIGESYILEKSNMLKILIELSGEKDSAEFLLDKFEEDSETSWSAPNNEIYSIKGIRETGAILFDAYGLPPIICRSPTECQDNNASTTDICFFPDTYKSFCGNEYEGCTISCNEKKDCTEKKLGECIKPGSCSSYCLYGEAKTKEIQQNQENKKKTGLYVELQKFSQKEYKKGSFVRISATVFDNSGKKIFDARMRGENSQGVTFPMRDIGIGTYEGFFQIPNQIKPGIMYVKVIAEREGVEASDEESFKITNSKINLEITTKKSKQVGSEKIVYLANKNSGNFEIGEKIIFNVKAEYENTEPVITDNIYAEIKSKPIQLKAIDKGLYEGEYLVGEKDEGTLPVKIYLDDGYGNLVEEKFELTITGITLTSWLLQNSLLVAILGTIALILIWHGFLFIEHKNKINELKKREAEIITEIKNLQTEYFINGKIDKNVYTKKMTHLEPELKKIRQEISAAQKNG